MDTRLHGSRLWYDEVPERGLDLLFLLPSSAATGTDPEPVWAGFPPARTAAPDAVTVVLVALTGFFLHGSMQPEPRNLPRLREFQRTQGEAALRWLRRRGHPLFS